MLKHFIITILFVVAPAIAWAADDFTKLDAEKDGQVSLEELNAAGIGWNSEQFASADKDGSGTLSRAEYEATVN